MTAKNLLPPNRVALGTVNIRGQEIDVMPKPEYRRFFEGVAGTTMGPGQAVSAIAPTASPFTYSATVPGLLVLSGGTVSAVTLTRGSVSASLPVAGAWTLLPGDSVAVTYSVAPDMKFFSG